MSSEKIEAIVFDNFPMPPSMNQLYPTAKHGRRFKNKKHPFFNDLIFYMASNRSLINEYKKVTQRWATCGLSRLAIERQFFFKTRSILTKKNTIKKMDITNRVKVLDDEICRILEIDDSQFFSSIEHKLIAKDEKECVRIIITPETTTSQKTDF